MRIVPVHCVKKGTILAKSIYNDIGNVLLKRGAELTPSLLGKVESAGVFTLYIDDGYSDEVIDEVIRPELKLKAVSAIKDTFSNISSYNANMLQDETIKSHQKKAHLKSMEKYMNSLSSISDGIVDDLLFSSQLLINMVDIKNTNTYTYEHSLNVAILSLILGIELKMSKPDLMSLFIGALLHDIGKAFIPQDIIKKTETLTEKEEAVLKTHAQKGYEYLTDNYHIDPKSRMIVLQHHECYNGTGYPKGMANEKITKGARIVAIANTYDSLTSDSPNSKAVHPDEAMEYLMGNAGTRFDFDMVNTFVRKIIPYPPGSLIKMSNGATAVVTSVNSNFPLRPKIEIIKQIDGMIIREPIDMLKNRTLTIMGIQYDDPNPE